MNEESLVHIPLTVPRKKEGEYLYNYDVATRGTNRMMIFAGDQKVEHLNDDFVGEGIPPEVNHPEHFFKIASQAHIGVFASQLGVIASYGADYPDVPYLVKLNSKSNVVPTSGMDPVSKAWHTVEDVVKVKDDFHLDIVGVGYTIYVGSKYENEMLREAARIAYEAHQHGLLAVFWMYPRGEFISDEKDAHLIAGAAGVGHTLGADFVKVNYPASENAPSDFVEAIEAAGRTGVLCSGGSKKDEKAFLEELHSQIHESGARGTATGRNIYQRPVDEAVRMADAISSIVYYGHSVEDALAILQGSQTLEFK